MTANPLTRNTAAGQLGGYLYQVEVALIRLLTLEEGEILCIEGLEDFHVESPDKTAELSQTKHEMGKNPSTLTNRSINLWKPLANWTNALPYLEKDFDNFKLLLITNSELPPKSIANLIASKCSVGQIIQELRTEAAKPSETLKPYMKVIVERKSELARLLPKIDIISGNVNLAKTTEELGKVLRGKTFRSDRIEEAIERLRGWFHTELANRLDVDGGAKFSESECYQVVCSLRDSLIETGLPTYSDAQFDIPSLADCQNARYIRQLTSIDATNRMLERAVSDYWKTRTIRSKWINQVRVLPDQLAEYDNALIYKWESKYNDLLDSVEGSNDDTELKQQGMKLYKIIQEIDMPFRPHLFLPQFTPGSYHRLAEELRVGWHPHFKVLMSSPGE